MENYVLFKAMEKFQLLNKLSLLLILISIFLGFKAYSRDTKIKSDISSIILSNIDTRFIYLLSVIPLFYYLKTYIKENLIL